MREFKYLDHLRTDVFDNYYKRYFGNLLDSLTPEERSAVKIIESDSWEAGICQWSQRFAEDFQKLRGYNPVPYLPVLAGKIVESKDVSARFRDDYNHTISDLIVEHYRYQQEVAHKDKMLSMYEASGPHQHYADALLCQKYSDLPMGEFWVRANTHRITLENRFMSKEAVSAAHIYGKKIIPAESFTLVGPLWKEDPWYLKPTADRAFCEGINQIYMHTYSHSPSLTAKPGYVYSPGTHFDRNITWWDYSLDWTTFLIRCQYMLQKGLPQVVIALAKGQKLYDKRQSLKEKDDRREMDRMFKR
ncbi:SsrA-binding protein [termite gut metagenome]|uniref:SsrA-binding protein n=1 Tax=termite gut metagenome TaxID=433724 RepID=A0A5J4Q0Z9_9ZZZZ